MGAFDFITQGFCSIEFTMKYGKLLQRIPKFSGAWTLSLEFKLLDEIDERFSSILQFRTHDKKASIFKIVLVGLDEEDFIKITRTDKRTSKTNFIVKREQLGNSLLNEWHKLEIKSIHVANEDEHNMYILFDDVMLTMETLFEPMTSSNILLYHKHNAARQPKIILRDLEFHQEKGIIQVI